MEFASRLIILQLRIFELHFDRTLGRFGLHGDDRTLDLVASRFQKSRLVILLDRSGQPRDAFAQVDSVR